MLQISGLSVTYGKNRIISGLDLELSRGDSLAIVGESGAGKTTLGLSIMGLLNGNANGMIKLNNVNILSLSEAELRSFRWRCVAMSFQSAQNRLNPTHRILDQVAEPMIAHNLGGKNQARDRAAELLKQVNLAAFKLLHYPHQLSGGEQQRVLLAMSLINDPELLILDEPISSLDAEARLEILSFLKTAIINRTVIIVTHDLSVAAMLAVQTATLYAGRIVESGPTGIVLSYPRHPYTRTLLRSYPDMTTTKDLQGIKGRLDRSLSGCAFHQRCTQALAICSESVPALMQSGTQSVACHRGGIIPALLVKNMKKSYGNFQAVKNVSLMLEHGETLALVGQSGSGKTTLAKMIAGILKQDAGEIHVEGNFEKLDTKYFHRTVQLLFQNPGDSLSHRLTVLESVREPLEIQAVGNAEERTRIAIKSLEDVELLVDDHLLNEYPHHLSGGELQRVNIARALVLNPKILIADEPTSFLDSSVQAKILKLLMNLQENRGLSMLFITHDIAVARKISDRIAIMKGGQIVEEGLTSLVLARPAQPYTRELIKASSRLELENRK